jgi:hypothetical protein
LNHRDAHDNGAALPVEQARATVSLMTLTLLDLLEELLEYSLAQKIERKINRLILTHDHSIFESNYLG